MNRIMITVAMLAVASASASALAQERLPFPPVPSGSTAGRTIEQSMYKPRAQAQRLPKDAPNILVIMLDDVGPALPNTYGGDITSSTLTRVASAGISFNRFHNAAMCSPTRASLLTGRNHHRVAFGQIAELANDWDGYTGMWPPTTASVAKVLGSYGYATSAFGKWHNTPASQTSSVGPYDRWPTGRLVGFDYFYGFLAGESSQWEPAVVENTVRLAGSSNRHGYHFTEDMTGKAIKWMRQERALTPERPFLMYWAPGAAHGPHHIFKEWADKYKGKFDDGWDAMRDRIFARQKELGWIPANTELTPRPPTLAGWTDIPEEEKPFQRRLMEVFAGYVEHADTQAGRLLDELDHLGIRDNTLIFYVWGDNGSSAEGQHGTISELLAQNGIATEIEDHIRALNELGGLDALGGPKTDNMYHAGWAWAGSTPHQGTKLIASHFGGSRTPLAVSWPKSITPDKAPRTQFHHVNDIVPTIYDVIGIKAPQAVDGVSQDPLDGISMKYAFAAAAAPERKKSQYFEVMGSRGLYQDGFIASAFGPRIPWVPGIDPSILKWSPDTDTWELYDLRSDYSQARDLAKQQPKKLAELKKAFDGAARANKVYPIGGGLWSAVFHPEYAPQNPATEFHYTQDVTMVPEFAAPKLGARSNRVTIDVDLKLDSAGVLYALGGFSGGLALWIQDGKLIYEYNLFELERTRIEAAIPVSFGKATIEVDSRAAGTGHVKTMDVTIRINGQELATGRVPRNAPLGFTANDAFDVGMDSYSPVSLAYFDRAPFKFNGKINSFEVRYQDPAGDPIARRK
ncbi:Arylsulfatase A-related enzyme [Nitrospira japonica]|uniref:Arylsulfatase A-related enzyme n=1 Tax=Nitrospira japonica TaxID=1325564 RepID=A0A1W1I829_9BACT|nr:arylsulfatase [Nitrospira japonica]SLM49182.1 Arylsulfatase A-related enzyme [Nitrospira japonica]